MYLILDKDMIEMEIIPNIPIPKRGFPPTVSVTEIINAILYKLKTAGQWYLLPVDSLFDTKALSQQCVYYHYRQWCLSESWQRCWESLLRKHKAKFDLSSVDLDGSHTTVIRSGNGVDYQGRKKRKTTALYLTDRQGLPLEMSQPVSGNHNDLYNIEVQFQEVTTTLEESDIVVEELFLNADTGFDPDSFRKACNYNEINATICFNKRNGDMDRDEF